MNSVSSLSVTRSRTVALPELLSALSFALDLTEGAVPGHALRSCLIGMRIADAIGLDIRLQPHLYYALLLKDVGCSSNAARMTQIIGGDDRAMKASTKLEDWRQGGVTRRGLKVFWKNLVPGASLPKKLRRFAKVAYCAQQNRQGMIQMRCERGAQIIRKLELDAITSQAVHALDEHWDGGGYPEGLKGSAIPLLARICSVAQNLDVFAIESGITTAVDVLRKRSGVWFDPEIAQAAERLSASGKLWQYCRPECPVEVTRHAVMALDPGGQADVEPERIDAICEAFAAVVDAKSPFTFRHSIGVAVVAEALAQELRLAPERRRLVRRAALLHDLGKLGISNAILDKTGPLTDAERAVVEEHPFLSYSILARVSSFQELATIAAEHHERLDGSGYPKGLTGKYLSVESRLLAVADSFSALVETRPYRHPIAVEEALNILRALVPLKLDADCFAALEGVASRWHGALPQIFTSASGTACMPEQGWSGVRPAVLGAA